MSCFISKAIALIAFNSVIKSNIYPTLSTRRLILTGWNQLRFLPDNWIIVQTSLLIEGLCYVVQFRQSFMHNSNISAISQAQYSVDKIDVAGVGLVINETHEFESTRMQSYIKIKVNMSDNSYYRCEFQFLDGRVCRRYTQVEFQGTSASYFKMWTAIIR